MTEWQWFAVAVNFAGCAVNLALALRWIRLERRSVRKIEGLRIAYEDTIRSLLPAVAFCSILADDEGVPTGVRASARAAIPKEVTIVKEPAQESGRVH